MLWVLVDCVLFLFGDVVVDFVELYVCVDFVE